MTRNDERKEYLEEIRCCGIWPEVFVSLIHHRETVAAHPVAVPIPHMNGNVWHCSDPWSFESFK